MVGGRYVQQINRPVETLEIETLKFDMVEGGVRLWARRKEMQIKGEDQERSADAEIFSYVDIS
jgi:hypothetical protein